LEVTSKVALVSIKEPTSKAGEEAIQALPAADAKPTESNTAKTPQSVGDAETQKAHATQEVTATAPTAPTQQSSPAAAPAVTPEAPKVASSPAQAQAQASPAAAPSSAPAVANPPPDVEDTIQEMDRDRLVQLLPEMKDFEAALFRGFKKREGDSCIAADGGLTRYGCGWMPEVRSNMTVKEKDKAVCRCNIQWGLQQCWQPDADTFLKAFEAGDMLAATDVAKAYLAGRCYVPITFWVVVGIVVFLCACGGGWRLKSRRGKEDDPRLKGSSLDPNMQEAS